MKEKKEQPLRNSSATYVFHGWNASISRLECKHFAAGLLAFQTVITIISSVG